MAYDLEDGERAVKLGAYRQAFEIFMMLCANSEDPAYYKLSEMALAKQLKEDEIDEVVRLMEKEYDNHNWQATYNLGILYWRAPYSIHNLEKAVEMFNKACRMEVPQAFVALAKIYMGDGKHLPLATSSNIMNLLHEGFKLGSMEAAYLIAKQHLDGKHAKKDDDEAYRYLFISGRLGNLEAKKQAMIMQGLHPEGYFRGIQKEAIDQLDELESKMIVFK
ncbi:MAG: sel1 repeat family protein [Burkholderiaceae bacterium]|nr:sel1 repeat family protein [Burkholderiaceae bacterium]